MSDGDGRGIAVVGGGIAGAWVARHLALATDDPVTVLERGDRPGTGTTARSGAFVGHWGHESPTDIALLREGIRRYARVLADPSVPARYVHGGRLRLATTAAGDRRLREQFAADLGARPEGPSATAEKGAPVQYLAGESLAETLLLPDLAVEAVTGAIYSPAVGYVDDPGALSRAVADLAREAGAEFRTGRTVEGIAVDGNEAVGVRVGGDLRPADEVVCAAGPWNRHLLADAGVALPVRHTRGPVLVVAPSVAGGHGPALFHEETGVYTRPNLDGTLLVGHYPGEYDDAQVIDPDAVDDRVPDDRREACLSAVERLLPRTADARVRDEWVGVRSHTPDGGPIVGRTAVEGLSVVAFNAAGIQQAPAAGRIVAAQVVENRPTDRYPDVSVGRFDGHEDCRPEW